MKLTYSEQCIEDMSWGRPQTRVLRTILMGWFFSVQVLSIASLTSHTMLSGFVLGSLLSGYLSTKKGRSYVLKRSVILPCAVMVLNCLAMAQLSVFVAGLFIGTEIVVGAILAWEFFPPSKRYNLISISVAPSLAYLLLFAIKDQYEIIFFLLCLGAIIYDRIHLDESPVYLYETNQISEFKSVICKIHESSELESEYMDYYPILSESRTQMVYFHHEHRVKLLKLALLLLLCGVLSPGFYDSQCFFVYDLLGKCAGFALEKCKVNRKIGIIIGFGFSALSLAFTNTAGGVYHTLYVLGLCLVGLNGIQAFEAKRRGIASGVLAGSFAVGYFVRRYVQQFSIGVLLSVIGIQALFLKCKETSVLPKRSNKQL